MVKLADLGPLAVGVNFTPIEQLELAPRKMEHVFVSEKSVLFVPDMPMPLISMNPVPTFFSVTV